MIRFYGGGLVAAVFLGFWLWALFDVISTDRTRVRNLPRLLWLGLIGLSGAIGSMAWVLFGRPAGASFSPGGATMRRGFGDPVWLDEAQRRQRYAELDEVLDRRIEERRLREGADDVRRPESGVDNDGTEGFGP